jgi:NRPS condensation-like uncharacterized protein
MEICVTMDLRRYLKSGKAEAICNLSGVLNHRIVRKEETKKDTLSRVTGEMNEIKKDKPGLHSAAIVEEAYLVTPVFKAPSFMLGASTYQGKLTFTAGYCEPEVRKEDVKQFFLEFKKELLGL